MIERIQVVRPTAITGRPCNDHAMMGSTMNFQYELSKIHFDFGHTSE